MQADEKLEAALHFLEEMRKSTENRKIFVFNLDAFLCSSRSVTFVLQKEFASDLGFQKWYSQKQEEMRKDGLMNFFIEMRDVSIHERSPETKAVVSVLIHETASISSSVSVTLIHPNGKKEVFEPHPAEGETKQGSTKENPQILHNYFFVDRTDNDVITLCSQYLDKLFRLVAEAKTVS